MSDDLTNFLLDQFDAVKFRASSLRTLARALPADTGAYLVATADLLEREVEAKRRILDEHAPDRNGYCPTCCDNTVEAPCYTVMVLALPYADRPGYRDEWRP